MDHFSTELSVWGRPNFFKAVAERAHAEHKEVELKERVDVVSTPRAGAGGAGVVSVDCPYTSVAEWLELIRSLVFEAVEMGKTVAEMGSQSAKRHQIRYFNSPYTKAHSRCVVVENSKRNSKVLSSVKGVLSEIGVVWQERPTGRMRVHVLTWSTRDLVAMPRFSPLVVAPLPSIGEAMYAEYLRGVGDIKVRCQDGAELLVHESVFTSSGPLRALIRSGMSESASKEVSFPDINRPEMEAVLFYLYTRKNPCGGELVFELKPVAAFAHLYALDELFAFVVNHVGTKVLAPDRIEEHEEWRGVSGIDLYFARMDAFRLAREGLVVEGGVTD